ncbi:hypothetical protein ARZXY2_1116 [Arthrobacter sp. ZXY-2]|nr:hypothetical protein ARZXY2_1116 [Arthrobacter sp. ZXY-2]
MRGPRVECRLQHRQFVMVCVQGSCGVVPRRGSTHEIHSSASRHRMDR